MAESSPASTHRAVGGRQPALPRILLVDDEPYLLEGMVRRLRHYFDCTIANGGAEGIAALKNDGPFEVLVSDMRMPHVDGVAVLSYAKANAPDTVRVLLTGYADLDSAAAAVNEGNVFRILSKPMPSELMRKVLVDCVARHRSALAEQELLQSTVYGTVSGMLDALATASPVTFASAVRVKHLIGELLGYIADVKSWDVRTAAMMSQVGLVTLPTSLLEKLHQSQAIDESEALLLRQLPSCAEHMVQTMAAFDGIRLIIHEQRMWASPDAPLECKIIQLATDWEDLESNGLSAVAIAEHLRQRSMDYGEVVIEAMERIVDERGLLVCTSIPVQDLQEGMTLAEDIHSATGTLLVGRGGPIGQPQLLRVQNLDPSTQLALPTASITS